MVWTPDCILFRCFDDRWWVTLGNHADEYYMSYYRKNGRDFPSRDAALDYARTLARQYSVNDEDILEDLGSGD